MSRSRSILSVLTERSFWAGVATIGVSVVLFVYLLNEAIMPIWTRHDAALVVPDVREMTPLEAERTLLLAGLDAEMREQPYNPNLAADEVVDQSPAAATQVKPGRRVYFYINASPKELVTVPDVVTLSEGAARPQLVDAGLLVGRVELDSVRTPFENTVTRQLPPAGRQVPTGTRATLWLSRGVDNSRRVAVPDVVGLTPEQARERLRGVGLWVSSPRAVRGRVVSQDPARGTMLNPGREVTIQADNQGPPAPPAPVPTESDSTE